MSPKTLLLTAAVALAVTVSYEKYGKGVRVGTARIGN